MLRKPGTRLTYHAFIASVLDASVIDVHVAGEEDVLVGKQRMRALRVEQQVIAGDRPGARGVWKPR